LQVPVFFCVPKELALHSLARAQDGQPARLILPKSGNENVAQITELSRETIQTLRH